jgi:hypothetical protein
MKNKETTLSERFQIPIEKSHTESKSRHIYMTAHFPDLEQALQLKLAYEDKPKFGHQ